MQHNSHSIQIFTTISVRITLHGVIVLSKSISVCRTFYCGLQPTILFFHFFKRRPFI